MVSRLVHSGGEPPKIVIPAAASKGGTTSETLNLKELDKDFAALVVYADARTMTLTGEVASCFKRVKFAVGLTNNNRNKYKNVLAIAEKHFGAYIKRRIIPGTVAAYIIGCVDADACSPNCIGSISYTDSDRRCEKTVIIARKEPNDIYTFSKISEGTLGYQIYVTQPWTGFTSSEKTVLQQMIGTYFSVDVISAGEGNIIVSGPISTLATRTIQPVHEMGWGVGVGVIAVVILAAIIIIVVSNRKSKKRR